ncbi:alpha/beta hydrolase [Arenimonas sp.]|uniref:alpha/beta hydrolase n=1 Tax=Arenimonas sp. TaxID=1872635 RepID=UPI0037C01587
MTVLKGAAFILAAMLCVIPCGVRADVVDTPIPKPTTGSVQRLAAFPSRNIPPRDVDVWLPPGYSDKKKYAVLYMQDGQMLFDAGITWNKQEWQADETAARLMAEGKTRPFLIVGIHNGGKRRHVEYFPQKPFEALPDDFRRQLLGMKRNPQQALFDGAVDSDAYLKFVVEELKPYIDAHFSVDTGPEHTAVMGSSMGGLISMYAISEYPQVFGAAACVSTHWPGIFTVDNNPIPQAFFDYMQAALPDPVSHRIYFDHGTATLDALYAPLQVRADAVMRRRGYTDAHWRTQVFPGTEHSEQAWAARLDIPLQFLFPPD